MAQPKKSTRIPAPPFVWVLVEHNGSTLMHTDDEDEATDWGTNEERIEAGQRVVKYRVA